MVTLLRQEHPPVLQVVAQRGEMTTIDFDHVVESNPSRRFTELLGLLLAQAVTDGMHSLYLGVNREQRTAYLRYCGYTADGTKASWDMVPPPIEVYAALVKALVECTVFETGARPTGTIHAMINKVPVRLRVELENWYKVEITWSHAASKS